MGKYNFSRINELTATEKEIERNNYILKKLKKGDFFGLPKEYKEDPEKARLFHEEELKYFMECKGYEDKSK